jgi:hypothetical protein
MAGASARAAAIGRTLALRAEFEAAMHARNATSFPGLMARKSGPEPIRQRAAEAWRA